MKFTEEQVVESLLKFGFGNPSTNPNSPAQVGHGVSALSGGWRRRLDPAEAMLIDPVILRLESPNDLWDAVNVAWIQDYMEEHHTVDFTSQSEGTPNSCGTHLAGIRR